MVVEQFKNMHLQLSAEDIRKVDEWKISRGMKSRTEAIRSMIRIVTNGDLDEDISEMTRKMLSDNNSKFIKPEFSAKKQEREEPLEEMVRKIIKEELSKMLNDKDS